MSRPGPQPRRPIVAHRAIAAALGDWFAIHARDLPWRQTDPQTGRRDPYRSLVSELMLQQTQVGRVLEKFGPFMERFPTVDALAEADEQDVLAAWSGLGYYRRARLLQAGARDIVRDHGGDVPRRVDDLLAITGIGRYTAGAISSIVYGEPVPIVDGNVTRVLMRLRADERTPTDREVVRANWEDAAELAGAAESPGLTNEGLMELGAVVCTPKTPRCDACPLRGFCRSSKAGVQDRIPAPKAGARRTKVYHTAVHIRDEAGRVLGERRPSKGLWASMWQVPTEESATDQPDPKRVLRRLGLRGRTLRTTEFVHITSHREVVFVVHRLVEPVCGSEMDRMGTEEGRAAIPLSELDNIPLANPHRRIFEGAWPAGIER